MNQKYPYPIIFSAIDRVHPYPQLNFKDVGGSQNVFSRTNYNLFLKPEEAKNLSWKIFLEKLEGILGDVANKKLGDRDCYTCARAGIPCRIFVKSLQKDTDVKVTKEQSDMNGRHTELWNDGEVERGVPLEACILIQTILKMTETEAERKFVTEYLRWVLCCNSVGYTDDGEQVDRLQPVADRFNKDRGYLPWQARKDFHDLVLANVPAFIPQVWLNYIYNSKVGPRDPERSFLKENASRVDFVMLWGGMRHVIEIDGPEHYATFKDGNYVINEESYTKNLKIERNLRNSGWNIHRFSNSEVIKSRWFGHDFAVELGLMSFEEPWWNKLSPK